jgi:hypothetical protein
MTHVLLSGGDADQKIYYKELVTPIEFILPIG